MATPLRVLIVEDSEDDEILVLRELKSGGYEPVFSRVDTAKTMAAELERETWDIVISGHRMPRFKGMDALRRSEEEARRLAEENALMAEMGRIISSSLNIEEVYDRFAEEVQKLILFDRIVVSIVDYPRRSFTIPYIFGPEIDQYRKGETVPLSGTATEEILRTRSRLLFQKKDEEEAVRRLPGLAPLFKAGLQSIMMIPLISKDRVMGVLHIQSSQPGIYTERELGLAEKVAHQVAGAIANAQLFNELKGTTEALAESEQRSRVMVEAVGQTGEGVIILQGAGPDEVRCIFANERAQKILGYTQEELSRLSWKQVVHPSFQEGIGERYRRRMKGEESSGLHETIIVNKDSGDVPIEITMTVTQIHGDPVLICFFRDISDRKQAEEGQRRSELFLRKVLDSLPIGVSITDKDGKVLLLNPARQIWAKNQFEDVTQLGRYQGWWADTGKEVGPSEWGLARAVKSGETTMNQVIYLKGPKGEKRTILNSGVPIRDGNGEMIGAIGLNQDITELKQAEEAIKKTKEFYETVINSMKDALAIIDVRDFKIVDLNKEFLDLLGRERADVVGKPCYEVTHKSTVPCASLDHACPIASTLKTGNPSVAEHVHYGKEGRTMYVEVSASPIKNERGEIIQVVHVEKDITEQKSLQSQLGQAQKLEAVGQLAAGIAHEINTPTQYVGDNTRFLQDVFRDLSHLLEKYGELLRAIKGGKDSQPELKEVEETIEKIGLPYLTTEIPRAIEQTLEGVERVTKIVRAMKEFSHPGIKEKTLADINKSIENTVTVSRNEWKYVAEMVMDLAPSLPLVPCLLGEFNQAILNIIINAAHAIGEVVGDASGGKGTITVSTRQEKGWAEVRISDTGSGIPENIRSRIFDPFFTTKKVGKGTGQGLAIAHSVIVKKHGGTIHFETKVGEGTTFIIRLPLADGGEAK